MTHTFNFVLEKLTHFYYRDGDWASLERSYICSAFIYSVLERMPNNITISVSDCAGSKGQGWIKCFLCKRAVICRGQEFDIDCRQEEQLVGLGFRLGDAFYIKID